MAAEVQKYAPQLNMKISKQDASTMEEWAPIAKVVEERTAKE
jgi:hypothetical protein